MSTPIILGVAQVTNSSVTLVGQVQPSATASAFAVFSYWNAATPGTVLTSQVRVFAGGLTDVVQAPISGLTSGATYCFTLTFLGLTSQSMSFVAQLPLSSVLTGTAGSTIDVPHMSFPVTFSTSSGVDVCDQDSDEDVVSCVKTVLNCVQGAYPEVPSFGIPDLTFSQAPVPAGNIASAVLQWESRADISAVASLINDGTEYDWAVGVTVTPKTS